MDELLNALYDAYIGGGAAAYAFDGLNNRGSIETTTNAG